MLRKHPELFSPEAVRRVGVVAGLAVRTTRLAARGVSTLGIMREVAGPLLAGIAQVAGEERGVYLMLGALRRAWIDAANRSDAERILVEISDGEVVAHLACPGCGTIARRKARAPAMCVPCGFVFVPVDAGEGEMER